MNTLLFLLLACGTEPAPVVTVAPPPASGAEELSAFLTELCDAGAVAATPLVGELPVREVTSEPSAAFPRLTVSRTEATWNSMPVTLEALESRVTRHEVPSEVVVQASPEVPAERMAAFVAVLRETGVGTVLAAVRSASPPAIPEPPDADLVQQLNRIPHPHLRIAELQRQLDAAVGDCGHAQLAFTIATTDTGDRCDVWRRQLAPALNLCPDLSADRLATLTWIMEHPDPDSFWATIPVPSPVPAQGTWNDVLP